ncbi:MAG TPA: DUF1552 domain-containing protein [Planctomycetota bacterium]|nr:DUF1552 domain-containing protein [Planctomycetota bacterium]
MISDMRLSRRTFLRGVGASLALPLLDVMGGDVLGAPDLTAAEPRAVPVRMACLYMPNGVNPHAWTPEGTGRGFRLSEILEPLGPHREEVLVLTELMNAATRGGDGHYVKTAGWLTGTTITKTTGSRLDSGGASMDQVAAKRIGHLTPLPSLELGIEPVTTGVDTNVGYTRLYGSHIAWSTPTTPLAKEINPRLAFDRLFRSGAQAKRPEDRGDRSVLDLVREDTRSLLNRLGHGDSAKLAEYLDSVRAVEKRIDFEEKRRAGEYMEDPEAQKEVEALGGRITDFYKDPAQASERRLDHTEHVRLMLDIMVLAFWTDSTRVATFLFGNAVSGKNFSFLEGVRGGHHQISHHEKNPAKLEEYKRINTWHIHQLAYMLERMRSIREGDRTLLDNSMVLFGAGLRDGNAHDPHNLPILLAGRAGGTLQTGRHLVYPKKTPLCNLYSSMLRRMGTPVDRFGDSTGDLPDLDRVEEPVRRARV